MDFEQRLKEICNTDSGPYLRPFRPNADWMNATVFIVGNNPATPLREQFRSFDAYWDSLTRNPAAFERAYDESRNGGDSRTTRRIKDLCNRLDGINYLVTNACAYPVAHNGRVPSAQWGIGEQLFRSLLACCTPGVIFAHGSKAQSLVERLFSVSLDPYLDPDLQGTFANQTLLLSAPHLSGAGMKRGSHFHAEDALPKFARRIRSAVDA
jgi:hypothetical protein